MRKPGNEYINAYIPLINDIFKTNHDVKFLAAGEGPEKAFYTINYTAKPQLHLENPLALHLTAFDKAQSRVEVSPDDPISSGKICILSMCCTLSNPHEVSAPLAGLYILRGTPFYSSHEFSKLYLRTVLDTVFENEAISVMLHPKLTQTAFSARSVLFDYMDRPMELDNVNLMDFVAEWVVKGDLSGLRFCNGHAQHNTHSIHHRNARAVVSVISDRLPDTRQESTSMDKMLSFRRSISALFRPFRRGDDFGQQRGNFDSEFEEWWLSDASKAAREYTKHNNDYYTSPELARETNDDEMVRFASYTNSSVDVADETVPDDEQNGLLNSFLAQFGDDDYDEFVDGDAFVPRATTLRYIRALNKCVETVALTAASAANIVETNTSIQSVGMNDLDQMISDAEKCFKKSKDSAQISTTSTDVFPTLETRIELVTSALAHIEMIEPNGAPAPTIKTCPSLQNVSQHFRLNQKQHTAFTTVGIKLLKAFIEYSLVNYG